MGKKPDLDALETLFNTKTSFQLTDAQYEEKTGISLPKGKSYLLTRSALAKRCREKGFRLSVQEKTVFITKEENS